MFLVYSYYYVSVLAVIYCVSVSQYLSKESVTTEKKI